MHYDGEDLNKQRLIRKAFAQLKHNYQYDRKLADTLYQRRMLIKTLVGLKKGACNTKNMRKYKRNLRTICRLFKLRVIMREWKNNKKMLLETAYRQ